MTRSAFALASALLLASVPAVADPERCVAAEAIIDQLAARGVHPVALEGRDLARASALYAYITGTYPPKLYPIALYWADPSGSAFLTIGSPECIVGTLFVVPEYRAKFEAELFGRGI